MDVTHLDQRLDPLTSLTSLTSSMTSPRTLVIKGRGKGHIAALGDLTPVPSGSLSVMIPGVAEAAHERGDMVDDKGALRRPAAPPTPVRIGDVVGMQQRARSTLGTRLGCRWIAAAAARSASSSRGRSAQEISCRSTPIGSSKRVS
jgi:hypothetical protein